FFNPIFKVNHEIPCCQIVVIAVIMINVNTYRIPKDLFEYYKWKHFLKSVVNKNEQLCSLLKLSQIMLLSFLCQSCILFSLVLWSEFCVRNKPYLYTQNKRRIVK